MAKALGPKLHEIRLPAGDVPGFSIAFKGDHKVNLDPQEWLGQGFDGVRFIGAGRGATHLRAEDGYHDSTLFVGPHPGIVQLEALSLHVAKRKAWHMGLALQPLYPKFKAIARDIEVVADGTNPDGGRRVWGFFSYQADIDFEHVTFDTADLAEHASYAHGGWGATGARWKNVTVNGCGSQGFKVRFDATEGRWVKGAKVVVQDCSFKGFGQPWGWRGGAGIVVEGGNSDVLVQRCGFYGRPGNFRCLMVDDGAGAFRAGNAPVANGVIVVDACGFTGGPGSESYSPIMRVGSTAQNPTWPTAKAVLVQGCAVYGERTLGQFSHIPAGKLKVTGCNTPQLKDIANAYGFDTTHQSQLVGNAGVFVPFNAGVAR